jgi:hypothetical protein
MTELDLELTVTLGSAALSAPVPDDDFYSEVGRRTLRRRRRRHTILAGTAALLACCGYIAGVASIRVTAQRDAEAAPPSVSSTPPGGEPILTAWPGAVTMLGSDAGSYRILGSLGGPLSAPLRGHSFVVQGRTEDGRLGHPGRLDVTDGAVTGFASPVPPAGITGYDVQPAVLAGRAVVWWARGTRAVDRAPYAELWAAAGPGMAGRVLARLTGDEARILPGEVGTDGTEIFWVTDEARRPGVTHVFRMYLDGVSRREVVAATGYHLVAAPWVAHDTGVAGMLGAGLERWNLVSGERVTGVGEPRADESRCSLRWCVGLIDSTGLALARRADGMRTVTVPMGDVELWLAGTDFVLAVDRTDPKRPALLWSLDTGKLYELGVLDMAGSLVDGAPHGPEDPLLYWHGYLPGGSRAGTLVLDLSKVG